VFNALTDLIWPPRSPLSGRPVSAPGELDAVDWASITFLDKPWCVRCGTPFSYPAYEDMECPACLARPPAFERARSAFVYDAQSRPLVLTLKHAGRTDALAAYGRWMARAGAELLGEADALIPVPLHSGRLRKRRFNQSLLLARSISKASGVPVAAHVLARVRPTSTQGGLSAKGRARNVAGAFKVRPRLGAQVAGRRLVVIDDVHTTGATLSACARALKRAGAENVTAITLARVVKPVDPLK
jgi:ComF family protein